MSFRLSACAFVCVYSMCVCVYNTICGLVNRPEFFWPAGPLEVDCYEACWDSLLIPTKHTHHIRVLWGFKRMHSRSQCLQALVWSNWWALAGHLSHTRHTFWDGSSYLLSIIPFSFDLPFSLAPIFLAPSVKVPPIPKASPKCQFHPTVPDGRIWTWAF